MQRIEDAVKGVLKAMHLRGISDYSIRCINWSIYRPIVNWHYEHDAEFCSDELLESLCERQKVRYEGGEISRKFYRSFVTASFRIHSYVTTGEVDFSIVKDARRYRPNESYQKLVDAILQSTDLTDGHKKRMSIPIRYFFCFIQARNKSAAQIGDRDFIDFIYEAAKTNKNNMTVVMRALRITATYLNDHQLANIKTDLSVFRPQTAPVHLIRPYTQHEINLVLSVIDSSSKTPLRDRAIILLAFNSGLRCVDIRNLKLLDIDWEKQELRIVQRKTGKPIAAPLNGKTLNAIADYILKERPKCKDNHVFIRAYPAYTGIASTSPLDYMIDKYCRLAGVEKKPYRAFHSLRRAFGTELAEAEVPVTSISQMLGIRDKFFMYLLYDSGCRVQEILDLKVKSFFIKNGAAQLHVVGKGNKFRATPISNELIEMFKEYCTHFHGNASQSEYLFYTIRNGIFIKMSSDNVQRFVEKYGAKARNQMPSIPHLHPHLFRHTRAMHLYMAGMPLEMVAQWLGHSQMETSLIYANATTEMKRAAIKKISSKENSVFGDNENFKYRDNDKIIKQLYGLS